MSNSGKKLETVSNTAIVPVAVVLCIPFVKIFSPMLRIGKPPSEKKVFDNLQ